MITALSYAYLPLVIIIILLLVEIFLGQRAVSIAIVFTGIAAATFVFSLIGRKLFIIFGS